MAWKPANLDATLNTVVQVVDAENLAKIIEALPLKECRAFEERIANVCGREALEMVEKAEAKRKKK